VLTLARSLVSQNVPADQFLGSCRRTNHFWAVPGYAMASEPQRRALRLLAASPDGCMEDFLHVSGITTATLVTLVNTGLAAVTVEKRAQKLEAGAANGCRPHGLRNRRSLHRPGHQRCQGSRSAPAIRCLVQAATRREFDIVMAWSVDRLSRSVTDLCTFLTEIHALKIDLYLHSQGLDTSTPMGKAMFQIAGVFAELERSILKERIMAGIARARDNGTKSGKPIGRPRVPPSVEAAIAKALQQGKHGIHKIAAKHSVGVGVVQRIKAALCFRLLGRAQLQLIRSPRRFKSPACRRLECHSQTDSGCLRRR
jgi:DNA invertase Pin-like site-specific DNA recombinase